MATTLERVQRIVAEQFGMEGSDVKPDASFVDDFDADSLDLPELIMSLEEEFGVDMSDQEAERIVTVRDVVAYFDARSPSSERQGQVPMPGLPRPVGMADDALRRVMSPPRPGRAHHPGRGDHSLPYDRERRLDDVGPQGARLDPKASRRR